MKIIQFEAGGEKYDFILSTNALSDMEDLLEKGVLDIAQSFMDGKTTFSELRVVVMCGLSGAAKKLRKPFTLDLDQVGDLIDEAGGLPGIMPTIAKAFVDAFPTSEVNEEKVSALKEAIEDAASPLGLQTGTDSEKSV